ncbi:MAG: glycosyltransferase family A protein [Candidatus Paceibacterota bacterium]|jgi:glycosyltransferase involved in cell wall biosynthesis
MISVVIPLYNEENTILKCLKAFEKQIFPGPFEIIVVNNNSTDRSVAVVKQFIKNGFLDVKLLEEKCQGIVFARQKGFLYAHYPIIATTDADSIVSAEWLERIEKNMRNKKVIACGGKNFYEKKRFPTFISNNFQKAHFKLGLTFLFGNNMAIRKKAFLDIGGFDLTYKRLEDLYISITVKRQYHYKNKAPILHDPLMNIDTSLRKYRHPIKFAKTLPIILKNYLKVLYKTRRTNPFSQELIK